MNKSELLASMAEKGKITKVDAERALNAFIQT
ncbi:MAG: HU family DNA-binding protein, partial [Parvimonas sp.]